MIIEARLRQDQGGDHPHEDEARDYASGYGIELPTPVPAPRPEPKPQEQKQ